MKRTLVAVALATVFVLALAMPAFAFTTWSFMEHNASYEWDGVTNQFRKEAGNIHVGGAQYLQQMRSGGAGKMTKSQSITMVPFVITVEDDNSFITSPTAVTKMRVTSTINLAAPPRYTYGVNGPSVLLGAMYRVYNIPPVFDGVGFVGEWISDAPTFAQWNVVNHLVGVQRWAAEVEADAGYSGRLTQDFEAAYGPYWGAASGFGFNWAPVTAANPRGYASGTAYVGDYFEIDQYLRTSMGTVKRYINISSPWSAGYLYEDFSVSGYVEVREDFEMFNVPAGLWPTAAVTTPVWHAIFLAGQ